MCYHNHCGLKCVSALLYLKSTVSMYPSITFDSYNISAPFSLRILESWGEECGKYIAVSVEHSLVSYFPYTDQLWLSVLIAIYSKMLL